MKQALLIAIFRNRPLHELHGGGGVRGQLGGGHVSKTMCRHVSRETSHSHAMSQNEARSSHSMSHDCLKSCASLSHKAHIDRMYKPFEHRLLIK